MVIQLLVSVRDVVDDGREEALEAVSSHSLPQKVVMLIEVLVNF